MAGHSRQFTPGGLPDNCETHCVSGESNPQPSDRESDALPVVPPRPLVTDIVMGNTGKAVVTTVTTTGLGKVYGIPPTIPWDSNA